ncbi:MAG: hypothetical protein KDF65_04765 [Anaerolineae bacterium]|nr:hypothetical protein [Anaerolineae bacterium]
MTKISLHIENEYDRLEHVIIGQPRGYLRDPSQFELVNEAQKAALAAGTYPTETSLIPEFEAFAQALKARGVQVHWPEITVDSVQDQTCPRDIGFVVGDIFVICTMRPWSRKAEIEGVRHLMANWQGQIIQAPADVFLEGGDVIIAGRQIFVGIGQRSDEQGVAFMQATFGNRYEIIPVPCQTLSAGEDVLHLDCTFNPLGLGHALIYPPGIREMPTQIEQGYELIEVNRVEAQALATNVFSVAPDTLIARQGALFQRLHQKLRGWGYTVIEVQFDGVPQTGGSFRCCTLPLRRS